MKSSITRKTVNDLVAKINFTQLVNQKMAEHNTNAMSLSLDIGHNRGYMYRQLQHNDQFASLIVILSHHLQTNLFEPYINLLPDEIRGTQREKDLQAEITTLKQQIADLTKERDIYKSIAMK